MTIVGSALASPDAGSQARIVVVDDSAVIRGLVSRWLKETGDFEIVSSASNGRTAVEAVARYKPEIVVLDIEMPEVDGLAALPLILKAHPAAKVIVISTLTQRNAEISLKCLSLGAVDYLAKPESARVAGSVDEFRHSLIEKLRALSTPRVRQPRVAVTAPVQGRTRQKVVRPQCLLIGASTGGPKAVEKILLDLKPVLSGIPVLIVQHMPPMFTSVFAGHIQTLLSMPAREARDGDPVLPGHILVAPGGKHMGLSLSDGKPFIRLNEGPQENFCRPAVDVLFREAASVFGASALAVVLTGMGSDGTQGARHLIQAGSSVIAQDEATSIVWGMPGSIVKAGLAREVLPLEAIGPSLKTLFMGSAK